MIATRRAVDVLRHGWEDAAGLLAADVPEVAELLQARLDASIAAHQLDERHLLDTIEEVEALTARAGSESGRALGRRLRRTVYEYLLALDAVLPGEADDEAPVPLEAVPPPPADLTAVYGALVPFIDETAVAGHVGAAAATGAAEEHRQDGLADDGETAPAVHQASGWRSTLRRWRRNAGGEEAVDEAEEQPDAPLPAVEAEVEAEAEAQPEAEDGTGSGTADDAHPAPAWHFAPLSVVSRPETDTSAPAGDLPEQPAPLFLAPRAGFHIVEGVSPSAAAAQRVTLELPDVDSDSPSPASLAATASAVAIAAEADAPERQADEPAPPGDEHAPQPLAAEAPEPATEEAPVAAAEVVPEPRLEEATQPAAEVVPEPPLEEATQPAAEVVPEPRLEETPEPAAEVVSEPRLEETPEPAVEVVSEPPVEETPEPAAEVVPEPPVEEATQPAAEAVSEPPVEEATQPATERMPEFITWQPSVSDGGLAGAGAGAAALAASPAPASSAADVARPADSGTPSSPAVAAQEDPWIEAPFPAPAASSAVERATAATAVPETAEETTHLGWRVRDHREPGHRRGATRTIAAETEEDPFGSDLKLADLRRRIEERLRRKRCDEAAALLQAMARETGGRAVADLAMNAGDRCRALGKSNAALNCYLAASRSDPVYELPLSRLADVCIDAQDTELAVSYLERIARLYRFRGEEKDALRVYRRIASIAPYREDVLTLLMNAQRSGRLE